MDTRKIKSILFPNNNQLDNDVLKEYHPLNVLCGIERESLELDNITILYGNNGSGKTTLLNLISEKIGCDRNSRFFKQEKYYLEKRKKLILFDYANKYFDIERSIDENGHLVPLPAIKKLITSDDIFKYIESAREFNNKSQIINNDIEKDTWNMLDEGYNYKTLADYERLKKYNNARKNTYQYLKKEQIEMKKQYSNGETSLMYYNDHILSNGIYLLDEPENCLSPIYQFKLAKLILEASDFENCQFIIATHSPFFLSIPGAKVYNLDESPVQHQEWYELENMKLYYNFFSKYKDKFEFNSSSYLSDDEFDELIDYLVDNNFSNETISIIRGNEEFISRTYNLIKNNPYVDEETVKRKLGI